MPGSLPPALGAHEVHLWQVRLDVDGTTLAACASTLTPDERIRAARYPGASPRRHFTVARGTLRRLLGFYLDVDPGTLEFTYGEHGKPALATPGGDLRFNVSHSGDVVLLAFASGRQVGVDVERTCRRVAWEMVATRFFERRELADLASLPPAERRAAFFRCWTRKEAFIKASGQGVAFGLANFAVTVKPREAPALVWLRGGDPAGWRLVDANPGRGYSGALCASGCTWRARHLMVP